MYKAFVSSTYLDLKEHRAHVISALRNAGFSVDPMEDWTSDTDEPKMLSQERVVGCDLCILLVAFRRGYVPEGETESVTQLEYRTAHTHGIDVLPFVLDNEAAWPRRFDELARDPLLELWRSQLQRNHVVSFFGHDPQSVEVAPALSRWLAGRSVNPTTKAVELPFTTWIGRPDTLHSRLYGRAEQLEELERAFKRHRIVVISGGTGTGKSRLAAEHTHKSGVVGFWTTAGKTPTQTLAWLADHLRIATEESDVGNLRRRGEEDLASLVQQRLAVFESDTLWVIDNVDDVDMINYLVNCTGTVRLLITTRDSRRQILSPAIGVVSIQELSRDAAVHMLCSRSDTRPNDETLPEIAEAVGCLPWALEMLAVQLGEAHQTPDRLLSELRKAPTPIELETFRRSVGASIPRPEGVYQAIAGILGSLTPDIREPLSYLAYLGETYIPIDVVIQLTRLNDDNLVNFLEACRAQSILTVSRDSVYLHPLTAAAIAATNAIGTLAIALDRFQGRAQGIGEAER